MQVPISDCYQLLCFPLINSFDMPTGNTGRVEMSQFPGIDAKLIERDSLETPDL